jgi:hypothetical protein
MVVTRKRLALALLICSVAVGAHAQENRLDTEITAFGGIRVGGEIEVEETDSVYDADDSTSFGLIWNTHYKANTEWEVYYSQQQTEFDLSDPLIVAPAIDLDLYTLQLGGTYLFDGESVQPFLSMTLGGTHVKTNADNGESDTFISGSIGLGLKFRQGERLGFRLEGRLHGVLVNESSRLFCSTGPVENVCAVQVEGDMLGQFEAFAGVTFRF